MTVSTPSAHPKKARAPLEDLTFTPSPANTVGVELELQVLDRETGDLTPGAVPILKACAEEKIPGVTAELMQSQLEVKTGVCKDVEEVRQSLFPALSKVNKLAQSLGYDLGMGGAHPFNRVTTGAVSPDERYQKIHEQYAWLTYQGVVYGMHVHVGVPSGDIAIGVANMLVQYLPHLLALSASSPFWQGVDTGMMSARSLLFRLSPHAGLPHYFANWKDFQTYCRVMFDCRAIEQTKDIHWDIRPRPQQGTVEIRICDMPTSPNAVLSLAALIRTMVIASQKFLEESPQRRRGDVRHHWVAVENKWLALRYGLDAKCVRSPGRKRQFLTDDLENLLERLSPFAKGTPDEPFLEQLCPVARWEPAAIRLRRLYRESGDWGVVMNEIKQRWLQEIGDPGVKSQQNGVNG